MLAQINQQARISKGKNLDYYHQFTVLWEDVHGGHMNCVVKNLILREWIKTDSFRTWNILIIFKKKLIKFI